MNIETRRAPVCRPVGRRPASSPSPPTYQYASSSTGAPATSPVLRIATAAGGSRFPAGLSP